MLVRPDVQLSRQMMMLWSQHQEYEADDYAAKLTNADDLRSALIKLHHDHLAFPMYDWLYSRWYLDHPPLMDRLDAIQ